MSLLKPATAPQLPSDRPASAAAEKPTAPARSSDLGAIQVSDELALMFSSAKVLLDRVLNDPETPANQQSQVLNSVSAILEKITKIRTELYDSERIRRIEQVLVRVMKDQPLAIREAFVTQYERALNGEE